MTHQPATLPATANRLASSTSAGIFTSYLRTNALKGGRAVGAITASSRQQVVKRGSRTLKTNRLSIRPNTTVKTHLLTLKTPYNYVKSI